MAEEKKGKFLIGRLPGWIWLAGCFLFLVFFLYRHMWHLMDSDMSSELILAKGMAENGEWVLSDHWIYSSELRVLNTQLVFSNLFRLTDNWYLVRILSNAVLYGVMILCFSFFCGQAGLKRAFPWIAGCLLLPLSMGYFDFILKGVYYIPHISISFLALGLLFYLVRSRGKKKKIAAALCLAALSFAAGLGGLRQLFILYGPLTAATLLSLYQPAKKILSGPGRECPGMVRVLFSENKYAQACGAAVGAAGCAFAGYLVNMGYLAKRYHFDSHTAIRWTDFSAERFFDVLNGWLRSFGYQAGETLFGRDMIFNLIAGILLFLAVCSTVILIKKGAEADFAQTVTALFFAVAAVMFTLFQCVTDMEYHDRYNLPVAVFAAPVLAFWLQQANWHRFWKRAGGLVLCSLCLILGIGYYEHFAGTERMKVKEERAVASFLWENGYYNGYASFWNANILTEVSNGAIEVWTADRPERLSELRMWLQRPEHFERTPAGRVFIVVEDYEKQEASLYARMEEERLIYQTEHLSVYGYESYEAIPAEWK